MFELVFLGTSASAPSVQRGLPAQIIKHNEHRFLVDCGEGTQRQILQSGLGFRKLNRLLVTHGHLDHILGIGGLVSTYLRWEAIDKLEIYAGQNALWNASMTCFSEWSSAAPKPPFPIQSDPGYERHRSSKKMISPLRHFRSTTADRIAMDLFLKKKATAPFWQKKQKRWASRRDPGGATWCRGKPTTFQMGA